MLGFPRFPRLLDFKMVPGSCYCTSIFCLFIRLLRLPRLLDFKTVLGFPPCVSVFSLHILSRFIKLLLGFPRLPRLLDFKTVPGSPACTFIFSHQLLSTFINSFQPITFPDFGIFFWKWKKILKYWKKNLKNKGTFTLATLKVLL